MKTQQKMSPPGQRSRGMKLALAFIGCELLLGALLMVSTAAQLEREFSLEARTKRAYAGLVAHEAFMQAGQAETPALILQGREVMSF